MNKTTKQLFDLYSSNYSVLSEKLKSKNAELKRKGMSAERATNPLLLSVDDNYLDADLKIMVFGQETNLWFTDKKDGVFLGEIQPVIDFYNDFYWSGYCYSYGGQFWNGIAKFKEKLKEKYPKKKIEVIWNNVVKIGKCEIGFPSEFNEITHEYFNVTTKEIELTQPDAIVFFSGPNYDNELETILGKYSSTKIGKFTTRQLCMIENEILPNAFRTYHPGYLWRNNIDAYLDAIVRKI